jgi:death-on-curing protein
MSRGRAAPRFLSREAVVALHRESLAEHGGLDGIRDDGLLDSALHRCTQRAFYEPDASITDLAAALAFGLSRNHPFNDGNKRIALVACFAFLELNGRSVAVPEVEAYEVFMALASGDLAEQELADWLRRSCA